MARFYARARGSEGEATRQGSQHSGLYVIAETWGSSARVDYDHLERLNDGKGGDRVQVAFGGKNSGRRVILELDNPDDVVKVMTDPKMEALFDRMYGISQQIQEEAPKAARRAAQAKKREEREEARRDKMQQKALRDMQPEEKARIVRLFPHVEINSDGNIDGTYHLTNRREGDLRIGNDGHVYVSAPIGFGHFPFDVTDGVWVLPVEPDDLGMSMEVQQGFGYRVDEVTA